MVLGTTAAIILGATALAGTVAANSALGKAAEKKNNSAANEAAAKAKQDAEQKALMETQAEEKTSTARKALLSAPTSGFGPNTNLARSFLTTL